MAETFRDIGSLKKLKNELLKNSINDVHSVKEINSFISEYPNEISKIELKQKENLDLEIIEKNSKLQIDTERYIQKLVEQNDCYIKTDTIYEF